MASDTSPSDTDLRRAVSNTAGRWYFITNEGAKELRIALAGAIEEIPTGLGNEVWGPKTRKLFEELIEKLR